MTNEEFQKLVLEQLSGLRNDIADIKQRQLNTEAWQENMSVWQKNTEAWQKNTEAWQKNTEAWQKNTEAWQKNTEAWQKNMDVWKENTEAWQKKIEARLTNVEVRQDEIYQVVKAIEHSNQVGKAELDSHDYKIAKLEGKFKAAGKIFDADEIDAVSNL